MPVEFVLLHCGEEKRTQDTTNTITTLHIGKGTNQTQRKLLNEAQKRRMNKSSPQG